MTNTIKTKTLTARNNRWALAVYPDNSDSKFVMDLLGYPDFDLIIHGPTLQDCLDQIKVAELPE